MDDNSDLPALPNKSEKDMRSRPSRARYDKVKSTLDMKWRRRAPQIERMTREIVDELWDAFGGSPWTWCGLWIMQPDGTAFHPGPARPEPARASVSAQGPLGEAYSAGEPKTAAGSLLVPVLDFNGKAWAVFEVKSPENFDDMDLRWVDRLFKVFQTIEKISPPVD